ncbi:hypothetical protein [Neobacillus driksii]|uniref:hypothetical protein n=1 Tax=Neobacillus driksii TaxID=3035913 RepID=UPI0015C722B1|nr:hypothetical protein [Neobacillus niacini]
MIKRKTSAYLPLNELRSAFNRKFSAYFTFAWYSIKDQDTYFEKTTSKPTL